MRLLRPEQADPPAGEASADRSLGSGGIRSQLPSARLADVITNHLAAHQEDQIQISVQKNKRQVFKEKKKYNTQTTGSYKPEERSMRFGQSASQPSHLNITNEVFAPHLTNI